MSQPHLLENSIRLTSIIRKRKTGLANCPPSPLGGLEMTFLGRGRGKGPSTPKSLEKSE